MHEWMRRALCAAFPTLPWTAEPQHVSPTAEAAMELVCRLCPVQATCRTYVEGTAVTRGFWAGADRSRTDRLEDGAA